MGEKEVLKRCCGASYLPKKIREILTVEIFAKHCCIHDKNYTTGGTEKQREFVDSVFLEGMLEECEAIENPFKRNYYKGLANVYYFMVRRFGKKSFNYKQNNI